MADMHACDAVNIRTFFKARSPDDIDALKTFVEQEFVPTASNIKALADISRDSQWRAPLREVRLLQICLDIFDPSDPDAGTDELTRQVIRFAGNCSIEDETCQAWAGHHIEKFARAFKCKSNFDVLVGAIYNIYSGDAVPLTTVLDFDLIQLITSGLFDEEIDLSNTLICTALSFVAETVEFLLRSDVLQKRLSKSLLVAILRLPTISGADDESIQEILNATLLLLQDPKVQVEFAHYQSQAMKDTPSPLTIGGKFDEQKTLGEHHQDPLSATLVLYETLVKEIWLLKDAGNDDSESRASNGKGLLSQNDRFQAALSDIAFLIEYPSAYQFSHDHTIAVLERWLELPSENDEENTHLRTCGLLILGNICRSDEISVAMVEQLSFHITAMGLLTERSSPSSALRHAAVGFLCNLAVAKKNKQLLFNSRVSEILLDAGDASGVAAASKLLRQLAKDDVDICETIIGDRENGLFTKHSRIGKLEDTSRLVVIMLRTFQQSQNGRSPESWMNEEMVGPILALTRKPPNSLIAAEGWLGLGLISRKSVGASWVYSSLRSEEVPFSSLNKVFHIDVNDASQRGSQKVVDNARVVVGQLIRHSASYSMSEDDKVALLEILRANAITAEDVTGM